jgi:toxin ParE1/3/4
VKLRVHSAAENELQHGAKWYEDQHRGLGEQFLDEYQETIHRILAAPLSYARIGTSRSRRIIRRCPLKRFPYYVAYEVLAHHILVLAVAHTKRRPNYWIRRR